MYAEGGLGAGGARRGRHRRGNLQQQVLGAGLLMLINVKSVGDVWKEKKPSNIS